MHPESSKINDMTKNMGCGSRVISHFGALLVFFRQIVSAIPLPLLKLRFFFPSDFREPYFPTLYLPCFGKICPIFNHSFGKHFFLSWEMIVIECIPCIGNWYSKHIRQFWSMCRSNMKLKRTKSKFRNWIRNQKENAHHFKQGKLSKIKKSKSKIKINEIKKWMHTSTTSNKDNYLKRT